MQSIIHTVLGTHPLVWQCRLECKAHEKWCMVNPNQLPNKQARQYY